MKKKNIEEEMIKRFWRFAYAKLFDMEASLWNFKDVDGEFETKKIFWRFYWITKINQL